MARLKPLEFAFSLTSCRRRSPAQIGKTIRAACCRAYATYPCQTCWPQAHCTVSVGTFFVNCCLQTGQGLVITYVITLFSLRARAACPRTSARCVPEELSLCGPFCPRLVGPRRGRCTFAQARPRATSSAPATTRSSSCGIRAGPW